MEPAGAITQGDALDIWRDTAGVKINPHIFFLSFTPKAA